MEKINIIKKETESLLSKMINNFEVFVEEDNGIFKILIKTDEAAVVIGKHGETIRAIQKILEVIFYKIFNQSMEILVNVNDFREKQKERLEILASQYAEKTLNSHLASSIKNLSSYERKIVHEYITKNYPDLTTYSLGEGRERRLVIDLKTNASKV